MGPGKIRKKKPAGAFGEAPEDDDEYERMFARCIRQGVEICDDIGTLLRSPSSFTSRLMANHSLACRRHGRRV
jgi:hypothetical protein